MTEGLFKHIKIGDKIWRYYDETKVFSSDIYHIETYYKWLEFIDVYDFNIYIIKTKSKGCILDKKDTSLFYTDIQNAKKLKELWLSSVELQKQPLEDYIKSNGYCSSDDIEELKQFYGNRNKHPKYFKLFPKINLEGENTIKIKNLQSEDLYYLYINILYEVLYFLPKVDNNGCYYYELIIIVNKKTDLNRIINHNFNLISVESLIPINRIDISLDLMRSIFLFDDNNLWFSDIRYESDKYDWNSLKNDFEETKILNENNNLSHDTRTLLRFSVYNKSTKLIDRNLYAKTIFRGLLFQSFSFDACFENIVREGGVVITKRSLYDMDYTIVSNYFELMGASSINIDKETNAITVKPEQICFSSMADNYIDLIMSHSSFSKEYILNGFIDFDNIKTLTLEEACRRDGTLE